jgi:CRISPR/Cas system CSM-associated protein Csm3 (group 7 of RAMP superfamily)
MGNNKLTGKIILKAIVTNTSPMLIASGKGDWIDFEVICDAKGNPFIPASGFAGMVRNSFNEIDSVSVATYDECFGYFWGSDEDKKESQSHIIIDDLKLDGNCSVVERDGVKINHTTNLGEDGEKYDYQLLEPGAKFNLNMEVTLREGFDEDTFLQFLYFIAQKGKKGEYQQGAFKSSGFGILKWTDVEIYSFDFPADGQKWLSYLSGKAEGSTNTYSPEKLTIQTKPKDSLVIEGVFAIKDSLIIRSDGDQTNSDIKAPDSTHLKNTKGEALLTAKTQKGAIRHRAQRIMNTIRQSSSEELINSLFGYVDVDESIKEAKPSRIKSFETKVENADQKQVQPRIKIDRFTGGTVEHALMQSQPLWHKSEAFTLRFEIGKCTEAEAALMLLVMKDLFNEDLPIGGEKAIGRGVLTGKELSVNGIIGGQKFDLSFNSKGITDASKIQIVNGWVSNLKN